MKNRTPNRLKNKVSFFDIPNWIKNHRYKQFSLTFNNFNYISLILNQYLNQY